MKTPPRNKPDQQDLKRVGECLYRSQSSNIYYAILKRGGKQIKRSLKTTDSALARRKIKDLREMASKKPIASGSGKITFSDTAKRWLKTASVTMKPSSAARQGNVVKNLTNYFGLIQIRKLSKSIIEDWATDRSEEISARTYNYERQSLIRIMEYALDQGLILENPARRLKRLKMQVVRPSIPTKHEFTIILTEIGKMRKDAWAAKELCELLAYSGCRLSEATSITWGDIDFENKQFLVTGGEKGTKNHESRTVPLFPALESFLRRRLDAMPEPPKRQQTVATIANAKKALAAACQNADLPHFTHHHLRHFFCSNAIEAGVDFKAIAGWLGHKDGGLLVAKTYGHLRDEHSAIMAQRMTFGVEHEDL